MSNTPQTVELTWPTKSQLPPRTSVEGAQPLPLNPVGHTVVSADNLDVLTSLVASGSLFDVIYIDPPYNTGNNFVYADSHKATIDAAPTAMGRRYQGWLDLLYPRLHLAHQVLADSGVFFVSIDHNCVHLLRLLLDEVFGPENFVTDLAVSLNPKGRQLGNNFARVHEYVLVYAKNRSQCALDPRSADDVNPADFPHSDSGGSFRYLPLRNTNKKFHPGSSPTMYFPLYADPDSGEVSASEFPGAKEVFPVFGDGQPAVWRWSAPKVEQQANELHAKFVAGALGRRLDVFQKDYLGPARKKKMRTIWLPTECGSTDEAVVELKSLIGHVFETPKPTKLLRRLLQTMPKDVRVLDFFAGSGTTGHAVMAQNQSDGGSRKFTLVQIASPLPPESRAARADLTTVADITDLRIAKAAASVGETTPIHYLTWPPEKPDITADAPLAK